MAFDSYAVLPSIVIAGAAIAGIFMLLKKEPKNSFMLLKKEQKNMSSFVFVEKYGSNY
jgi:hypothetical protein